MKVKCVKDGYHVRVGKQSITFGNTIEITEKADIATALHHIKNGILLDVTNGDPTVTPSSPIKSLKKKEKKVELISSQAGLEDSIKPRASDDISIANANTSLEAMAINGPDDEVYDLSNTETVNKLEHEGDVVATGLEKDELPKNEIVDTDMMDQNINITAQSKEAQILIETNSPIGTEAIPIRDYIDKSVIEMANEMNKMAAEIPKSTGPIPDDLKPFLSQSFAKQKFDIGKMTSDQIPFYKRAYNYVIEADLKEVLFRQLQNMNAFEYDKDGNVIG